MILISCAEGQTGDSRSFPQPKITGPRILIRKYNGRYATRKYSL